MDQKLQTQSNNLNFDSLKVSIQNAEFDSTRCSNSSPAAPPEMINVKNEEKLRAPRLSQGTHSPQATQIQTQTANTNDAHEPDVSMPMIQPLEAKEPLILKLPDGYDTRDAHDSETEAIRKHPAIAAQYHVVRLLGRGSQGSMWLAKNNSGVHVAIKAMRFDELTEWKSSEMFIREIETLKSMHVDGTPQYIDAIDASNAEEPYYFLVQTLIPGVTLEDMLHDGYQFSPEDITAIALAILPILAQLREFVPPIVHRDIKPSNLMYTAEGYVYLIDFGASMLHEKALGGTTVAGTAGYMAPEQCIGNSGPESDIYSLGATLVHLLTRVPPWQLTLTSDMKLLFKSYVPLNTSPLLVQLLEAMLDPLPAKRLSNLPKLVRLLRESDEATHSTKFKFVKAQKEEDKLKEEETKNAVKHATKFSELTSILPDPLFKRSWRLHFAWFIGLMMYLLINNYFFKTGISSAAAYINVVIIISANVGILVLYSIAQKKYNKELYKKLLSIEKWKEEKKRILK